MGLLFRLLFIIGAGLSIYGGFESYLFTCATTKPQEITVSQLGKPGPIANRHVTITEFTIPNQYLIEEKNGQWLMVWVPLFNPAGSFTERPVMAYVRHVKDEHDLAQRLDHPQLTGIITNHSQGFGQKQQQEAAPMFPGVDLSNVIAFEVGRAFPSPYITIPLIVLGLVMLVIGVGGSFGMFSAGADDVVIQPSQPETKP